MNNRSIKKSGISAGMLRSNRALARSVAKSMLGCIAIALISSAAVALYVDGDFAVALLISNLAAVAALSAILLMLLPLIRRKGEEQALDRFGIANLLTSIRILSSVPIIVSFLNGYVIASFTIYAIAAITDVIDGFAARRLSQATVIGVILDPVGDILTTEAAFFCLWMSGIVPGYLFALLTARYLQFFAGWIFLLLYGRKVPLSSTIAGKVVGVIQYAGIVLLISDLLFSQFEIKGLQRDILFIILGMAFAAVIISQTVIGLRAFRSGKVQSADTEGI